MRHCEKLKVVPFAVALRVPAFSTAVPPVPVTSVREAEELVGFATSLAERLHSAASGAAILDAAASALLPFFLLLGVAVEVTSQPALSKIAELLVVGELPLQQAVELVGTVELAGSVEIAGPAELAGSAELDGSVEIAGSAELAGSAEPVSDELSQAAELRVIVGWPLGLKVLAQVPVEHIEPVEPVEPVAASRV